MSWKLRGVVEIYHPIKINSSYSTSPKADIIDHLSVAIRVLQGLNKIMSAYKVNLPDEVSKVMVIRDRILKIGEEGLGQTVIFVRRRESALMLLEALADYGYVVTTIQGVAKEEDRDYIIKQFKDGITRVLISTAVVARGFDQSNVNVVLNYDLPVRFDDLTEPDYEVYLHRIRPFGSRKGAVFNLLCGDEDNMVMEKIERHLNHSVTEVPSWTNDDDFKGVLKEAGLM